MLLAYVIPLAKKRNHLFTGTSSTSISQKQRNHEFSSLENMLDRVGSVYDHETLRIY